MRACYYKILGVSVEASQDEIKKAFRLMALRWHPDRNGQDGASSDRFRDVLEAYQTLEDPLKRKAYDFERGYGRSESRRSGAARSRRSFKEEDILEEIFQGSRTRMETLKGNDLRFDLQIVRTSDEQEVQEWIRYERLVYCKQCMGNGRTIPRPSCDRCSGNGETEESCCVAVRVPPFSEPGSRLRILMAGDQPSPAIPPGDLVVVLHVVRAG